MTPITYFDNLMAVLALASPFLGVSLAVYIKKGIFYIKAIEQAVEALNSMTTANKIILADIIAKGDSPELVELLKGNVTGLLGLSDVNKPLKN